MPAESKSSNLDDGNELDASVFHWQGEYRERSCCPIQQIVFVVLEVCVTSYRRPLAGGQ